jgi:hypothetical protein
LCCAAARRGAGARRHQAGVLDQEVRGDAHGSQRNSEFETQNSNNDGAVAETLRRGAILFVSWCIASSRFE